MVFNNISDHVNLPNLKHLHLEGIKFVPNFLVKFLCKHGKTLCSLTLKNGNLIGGLWPDILKLLESFPKLAVLNLHQLAQDDFRTAFPYWGRIECQGSHGQFESWVHVRGPFKYSVDVAEWEDMKEMLGHFQQDLTVMDPNFHFEDHELYFWTH